MRFISGLFLLALATVGVSTPVQRDFNALETDLADISSKTNALDAELTAFPSSDQTEAIAQALDIHNSAVALVDALNHAAGDANVALTDAQATTILGQLQNLEPVIAHALDEVVQKKADFEAIPISGLTALIHQDLVDLQNGVRTFSNALLAITPADQQDPATALSNEIIALFDNPIAVYAS
ncbi:hypothetical protein AMATHDRAFT_40345 [Amanita thiersii Skay4041]|uniref:Hydrophobic surface binding protein n=1 Tax=Amanita thiersii Skay4041 TaxID=703135 RepID=A0A2A9NJJ1_9AGAR|nr:hypothetical protein AMATHDRAFT_40345 [Amanita thiersii Skay4041]